MQNPFDTFIWLYLGFAITTMIAMAIRRGYISKKESYYQELSHAIDCFLAGILWPLAWATGMCLSLMHLGRILREALSEELRKEGEQDGEHTHT